MNILHVYSGDFPAGSEAYAVSLAEAQQAMGHTACLCGSQRHFATTIPHLKVNIADRSWPSRIRNIFALKKIIRTHDIDLIHAHSRAASWVAHHARRGPVAMVSTLHGQMHVHRNMRKNPIYGEISFAVCENIRDHAIANTTFFRPENLILARNGMNL